ncbi:MAG: PAS domain-containing protein, partial [Acidobacteriota bacterium]|nr:PAS domain-containing protein [Acidobacteriota bacterium]
MLEQELFDLLEGTSDAAFSVTDQGEICSWNKAAEKLFGYSRSEAVSKSCFSLLQGRGTLGRSEERRVG